VGIEKVPGAEDKLGRAEIVGGADAMTKVGDAVGGESTLVGVHEIATSTMRTAIALSMR
jgi:hypothetical protein